MTDLEPADVLLINPPWLSKSQNIWHGIKGAMPSLGLLSIAAYLEKQGVSVRVLDIHVEKLSANETREVIRHVRPKVVGITVMTATAVPSYKIARLAKEADENILVVMGGVHAEALPEECLINSSVDLVVRGDGELTMYRIVSEFLNGRCPRGISGISYRDGNKVVHSPPGDVIADLNELPFPAYHLAPMHKYYPAIGAYRRLPAINMLMTRGCPGKCIFCNSAMTKLRTRDAEPVVEEIIYLKKRYGIREIQFYDDTFTIFKQNVFKFCELLLKRNVDVTWTAFVRTDCISHDLAKAMKAAGCHQMLFGVESGDEQILANVRKPIDREKTIWAHNIVREVGIELRSAFIFGNNGETMQTMQNTLDFAIELDPDISIFNVCTPYPGTQLFKWAKMHGYLKHEDWTEYEISTFLMNLPTLDSNQLKEFYSYAYQRFYRRPIAIWRRLKKISSFSQIADLFHAFCFIMLRHKFGARDVVRQDWAYDKKEDFFDFRISDDVETRLTYELHYEPLRSHPIVPVPAPPSVATSPAVVADSLTP